MSDDTHRFADEAAKRIGSSYGVYGGGITPGVALKSATGITRGEELFHRPELVRPWRSASSQRHAEAIVGKEQEIEVLTRKCTELRAQLAGASRELQNSYANHKIEMERLKVGYEGRIKSLTEELAKSKKCTDDNSKESEHKMALLRAQHEAETAMLNKKLKHSSDIANEMSASFMAQMNEVKLSAAREIDLVQKLSHARTSELTSEIKAANEAASKVAERAMAATSDLQAEMARNEERITSQLKQQEHRFDALRQTMQQEKTEAERQRDKAVADYAAMNEKMKVLSNDLTHTEGCFRDWNVRVLSDLDQIADFYAGLMRDIEGQAVAAPPSSTSAQIASTFVPNRLNADPDSRRVLEKVADAIHRLCWIKQHHANTSQHLLRRLKAVEGSERSSGDTLQRTQMELEFQYNRLLNDSLEAKAHQSRLESAMKEVKDSFMDVEAKMTGMVTRLNFFNSDLNEAVSNPQSCVEAPRGVVTFVAFGVEGVTALWESNPSMFSDCLHLLNRCLRAKLASFGGYECVGEGEALLFAFGEVANAYKFAAESHVWALGLPWPQALLNHYHAGIEHSTGGSPRVLYRGLRLKTGIHLGEPGFDASALPSAAAQGSFRYFGKVVINTLNLASMARGGQILASADVCSVLDRDLGSIGHPSIQPLGDRRMSPNTKDAQTIAVMQVTPQVLCGRLFHDLEIVPPSGDGLSPTFSSTRKVAIGNEIAYLRNKYDTLKRSVDAMDSEAERVSQEIVGLNARLRDARISARTYTPADGIAHAGAIDRLNSRCELLKDDVKRCGTLQHELTEWVRNLEDALTNFSRATVAEDDLQRKFSTVQQRANEKMYELAKTSDAKLLQLRNALAHSEGQNAELREQLSRPQSGVPGSRLPRRGSASSLLRAGSARRL